MRRNNFTINDSHFASILHLAFTRQAASIFPKWSMVNVKSMVSGQCKMLIAAEGGLL